MRTSLFVLIVLSVTAAAPFALIPLLGPTRIGPYQNVIVVTPVEPWMSERFSAKE